MKKKIFLNHKLKQLKHDQIFVYIWIFLFLALILSILPYRNNNNTEWIVLPFPNDTHSTTVSENTQTGAVISSPPLSKWLDVQNSVHNQNSQLYQKNPLLELLSSPYVVAMLGIIGLLIVLRINAVRGTKKKRYLPVVSKKRSVHNSYF